MKISEVKKLVEKTFKNHGLSNNHTKICSNAILNAELVGATSHGLVRLSSYCNRIKKKSHKPKTKNYSKKSLLFNYKYRCR